MSQISTGVGPVSGLPINDLVSSLIEIQRQPIVRLQGRLTELDSRKAALLKISAQVLAIRNAAARFGRADFLQTAKASSSNAAIVLASTTSGAVPGQFSLRVRRLATSQQVVSNAFASADSAPIGAGEILIKDARARINRSTPLSQLAGGRGIRLGKIRIQDRAGNAAEVDLTSAATVDDLVSAINSQTRANVHARIDGDRVVLEDRTGATTGQLIVSDVTGSVAADLGLAGAAASDGTLSSADLVRLSESTRLDDLNDGNGVRRLKGADDFAVALADGTTLRYDISGRLRDTTPLSLLNAGAGVPAGSIKITNKAGQAQTIDLSQARTIGDVKTAIESAGLGVSVLVSASGLKVTDNSRGTKTTSIEEVGNGSAARSLGILGSSTAGVITGKRVYSMDTLGDLLRLINNQPGNAGRLAAAISPDGRSLTLTDQTSGESPLQVTALGGSRAAEDLGLLSPASGNAVHSGRLLAGLNTVLLRSLNGGRGVAPGVIRLTDRTGAAATIDLTSAHSLAEVTAAINASGTGIRVRESASGLGLELSDASGGSGPLIVEDVSGTLAGDLKLAVNAATSSHLTGDLNRQYVSETRRLADLRGAIPFVRGRFRITDSSGASDVVDLTQGDEETVQDVLAEINSRPNIRVTASLNATGDGILLTDEAGGAGRLQVIEQGSSTARSLGILGESAQASSTLDGSLSTRITVGGADTLNDVAAAIRARAAGLSALVVRDGSSGDAYRLSLTSNASGRDAALAIDARGTNLAFETLVHGQDAVALFGPAQGANPLILTSSTNTITGAIPGVKLDLVGVDDAAATISVTRDVESVVKDVSAFVTAFNAAIKSIDDLTRYDPQTQSRSVLTGDSTAERVRQRLFALLNRSIEDAPAPFNRLAGIGVSLKSGSTLSLDEAKLRAALESNSSELNAFFTTKDKGFGAILDGEVKRLVEGDNGVIPAQGLSIDRTREALSDRISTLETLVSRRRQRLLAQYSATESVIARLQSQQSALLGLSSGGLSLAR